MKLRNCAYPEPSHIHVPRPSRSDRSFEQPVDPEANEIQLLSEVSLADLDLCLFR